MLMRMLAVLRVMMCGYSALGNTISYKRIGDLVVVTVGLGLLLRLLLIETLDA